MANPFNLAAAIAAAEGGDASQWETIARHLIAKQKPAKARKAAMGAQTWAHVILLDGREFLTSAYASADHAQTIAAHGATAQFRARMEDSGDRSDYGQSGKGPRAYRANFETRAFLDPSVKPVPVHLVTVLSDPTEIDAMRDRCFEQRGRRQGWWGQWIKQDKAA